MLSPLIKNMIEEYAYPVLDEESIDEFLDSHNEVVLFFTEDPKKFPETDDVAMILPELIKAFNGRFQAGVISQVSQRKLQGLYGFASWPALVFLRQGDYLGVIIGVQNWDDYLRKIKKILTSRPAKSPGFTIPVVNQPINSGH